MIDSLEYFEELEGPRQNAVVVPARVTYPHSASENRRWALPVCLLSQGRYSMVISSRETLITGRLTRAPPKKNTTPVG